MQSCDGEKVTKSRMKEIERVKVLQTDSWFFSALINHKQALRHMSQRSRSLTKKELDIKLKGCNTSIL